MLPLFVLCDLYEQRDCILTRYNVSVSKSNNYKPMKRLKCPCFSSLTRKSNSMPGFAMYVSWIRFLLLLLLLLLLLPLLLLLLVLLIDLLLFLLSFFFLQSSGVCVCVCVCFLVYQRNGTCLLFYIYICFIGGYHFVDLHVLPNGLRRHRGGTGWSQETVSDV